MHLHDPHESSVSMQQRNDQMKDGLHSGGNINTDPEKANCVKQNVILQSWTFLTSRYSTSKCRWLKTCKTICAVQV